MPSCLICAGMLCCLHDACEQATSVSSDPRRPGPASLFLALLGSLSLRLCPVLPPSPTCQSATRHSSRRKDRESSARAYGGVPTRLRVLPSATRHATPPPSAPRVASRRAVEETRGGGGWDGAMGRSHGGGSRQAQPLRPSGVGASALPGSDATRAAPVRPTSTTSTYGTGQQPWRGGERERERRRRREAGPAPAAHGTEAAAGTEARGPLHPPRRLPLTDGPRPRPVQSWLTPRSSAAASCGT
jgi:hypothetical protein